MTNVYQKPILAIARQNFAFTPLKIAILTVSALCYQQSFANTSENSPTQQKFTEFLEKNQAIFADENYVYDVKDVQMADNNINKQLKNQTLTEYDNFDKPIATFSHQNVANNEPEIPVLPDAKTTSVEPIRATSLANNPTDIETINPDDYLPNYEQDNQTITNQNTTTVTADGVGLFTRLKNKILNTVQGANYIDVKIANADENKQPAKNIKSALEQVTVESVADFNSSLNRLRQIALDASKAVGYYDTKVRFRHLGGDDIEVSLEVGEPVVVKHRLIDVRGAGADSNHAVPVYEDIEKQGLPKVGDIFNHREYEQTKADIENTSSTHGFFDAKWLNNSVDVILPDNVADVDLVYDTNQRYKFGDIKIYSIDKQGVLSDNPEKLPIKPELLKKLLPYQKGDFYYQPFITDLNNHLSATRYFNGLNVDVVLPNLTDNVENKIQTDTPISANTTIQNPDDYAPIDFNVDDSTQDRLDSVKAKADVLLNAPEDTELSPEEKISSKNPLVILANAISNVAKKIDKKTASDKKLQQALTTNPFDKLTAEQIKAQKSVPTYIVLDATKPREAEVGIGYETAVGMRAVAKINNNLVNKHGYQAGISMSVSGVDKAVEVTGSLPYKHPINDKFTGSLGYQHKKSDRLANTFEVESIYANISRNIRRDTGWNRTTSLRYRGDKLVLNDNYDNATLPYPFNDVSSNYTQESLLLGYALHKTQADNPINPSTGYSQRYSIEVASDKVLTDTNLAILKAGVTGLHSFGPDKKHQVLGRLDLGYIHANDFWKVPYRLRFFAGGDQSIRGFNTDTLSPTYGEQNFLTGGNSLAVGSLEYNYEFRDGLRLALFGDVGGAYNTKGLSKNKTNVGVGMGVRWSSPIGLVRLDVATGISADDNPVRIHFLIGSPL